MAEADAVKRRRLRWRCRRLAVTLFLASATAACGGGHPDRPPWLDSFAWMRAEIEQRADVLEALSGVRARLLRPPGGDSGDAAELRRTCQELDCLIVKWSVSGQDIDDFKPVPGMIVDR